MLTKEQLYNLIPVFTLYGVDDYNYVCLDEEHNVYTIDSKYHFWSNSFDEHSFPPDYIVIEGICYHYSGWKRTTSYGVETIPTSIKIYSKPSKDGWLYFYEDGKQIEPKPVP